MKSSIRLYKVIAFISFMILVTVQFFLVYNTYKLKDENFYSAEKYLINDLYCKSIRNDKVFPGAQRIIDKYIYQNMDTMEDLYSRNPAQFDIFKQKLCDSIFVELRSKSNMDSVFSAIIEKIKLNPNLQYKLIIESISITFANNHYIPLYQKDIKYPFLTSVSQTPDGIVIDGTLKIPTKQNQVTYLNITSPVDHSYQLAFDFYVDTPHRYLAILLLMMPTFMLSIFSIIAVVLIYFYTFRSWLKQKKLAEMRSDFVNSFSHEFHTPLATIIVANKNLQNEKILSKKENIEPLTSIIERQAQRLKTLFSRVLDLTVMNESTLEKKEYFLNDVVDKMLLDYRLKFSESNIQIEIEYLKESKNHKVLLDLFWFTTMLFNILENAIKYNVNKIKKIKVATIKEKENIEIHISDNGIGISPQTIKHIFEKFYRNKTNHLKDVTGLGLGLFYTKQCITAHGWEIKVQSKEREGSEFIIFIPIVKL